MCSQPLKGAFSCHFQSILAQSVAMTETTRTEPHIAKNETVTKSKPNQKQPIKCKPKEEFTVSYQFAPENQDQIMDNSSSVTKMDVLEYPADPDVARNKAWSSKTVMTCNPIRQICSCSCRHPLLHHLPMPSRPSNTRKDLREDQVAANLNFQEKDASNRWTSSAT